MGGTPAPAVRAVVPSLSRLRTSLREGPARASRAFSALLRCLGCSHRCISPPLRAQPLRALRCFGWQRSCPPFAQRWQWSRPLGLRSGSAPLQPRRWSSPSVGAAAQRAALVFTFVYLVFTFVDFGAVLPVKYYG